MKITLSGSMVFFDQMREVASDLEKLGHEVLLPADPINEDQNLSPDWKSDLIKDHFEKIELSDALLVCNFEKKGVKGYIGANTLIEMGVAFYLKKKIFLYNQIPELDYKDEVAGLKPDLIDRDLKKI